MIQPLHESLLLAVYSLFYYRVEILSCYLQYCAFLGTISFYGPNEHGKRKCLIILHAIATLHHHTTLAACLRSNNTGYAFICVCIFGLTL